METMLSETRPHGRTVPLFRLRAARLGLLLGLAFAASTAAHAQQITVTGTVTSTSGGPLSGATVNVKGTEVRTLTSEKGRYTILAPSSGQLTFLSFGKKPVQLDIAGRAKIDVTMETIAYLEQTVVTAYTEQRRSEITGAVSSVARRARRR
jgi:TonB-dependent starch-binding outer membrane protein SusC